MKYTIAMLCAFMFVQNAVASVIISVDKNNSVFFNIEGKDARKLFQYLEKAQTDHNGYVITEGGMNKTYLSSPAVSCRKANPDVYDPPKLDTDPDLYDCYMALSNNGTVNSG